MYVWATLVTRAVYVGYIKIVYGFSAYGWLVVCR